tara:strand:- start:481 stop:1413 length:933 start_codon:yes stop_codon:yes gene_type:complete
MFSVVFPGQGSQSVGMTKNLYNNFSYIKELFKKADDILEQSISKIILEGPQEKLNLTENTQPAIFLASYSIFQLVMNETKKDLNKAKFFAGHSLGEYSALAATKSLSFEQSLKLLKVRGKSMQSAVPKGEGGMIAVLGSDVKLITELLKKNIAKYKCFVANDNSIGQLVVSGKNNDLDLFINDLKLEKIKNIKLPVSAPFHCHLMSPATEIMKDEIMKSNLDNPKNTIISNVTSKEVNESSKIKDLLIQQIESPVRWRESVINMIEKGTKTFIEIGPGKVLSGLIKRINKDVEIISINEIEDLNKINLND